MTFYYTSGKTECCDYYYNDSDFYVHPVYSKSTSNFLNTINFFSNKIEKIDNLKINVNSDTFPLWITRNSDDYKYKIERVNLSIIGGSSYGNIDPFLNSLLNGEDFCLKYDNVMIPNPEVYNKIYYVGSLETLTDKLLKKPEIHPIANSESCYVIEIDGDNIAFLNNAEGGRFFVRIGTTIGEKLNAILYNKKGIIDFLSINRQKSKELIENTLPFFNLKNYKFIQNLNNIDFNLETPSGLDATRNSTFPHPFPYR